MKHVVVLAGGGGTRLWPASRRSRPKQLLSLGGSGESLLAATVRRLYGVVPPGRIWVVTAADQAEAVRAEVEGAQVIAEPAARNTAAAIGLATARVLASDPDAVIGVLPADHHISDEKAFTATVERAFTAAAKWGEILTVGIRPSRPETGFGYLELGDELEPGVARVARFVEKPDREAAARYLAGGRHLWNAGVFFFRATRMMDALRRHLPDVADAVSRGDDDAYRRVTSISIDYGVMEKESGVLTVPSDFGWSDVGSWSALAEVRAADGAGNVMTGEVVLHDARRNIVFADEGTLVALVGVEDLVVVRTGNAVLVMPRERAQDVREVVRELERLERREYL